MFTELVRDTIGTTDTRLVREMTDRIENILRERGSASLTVRYGGRIFVLTGSVGLWSKDVGTWGVRTDTGITASVITTPMMISLLKKVVGA